MMAPHNFDQVDAVSNILREMVCTPGDELLRTRCSKLGINWNPVEQIALEIRRVLRNADSTSTKVP